MNIIYLSKTNIIPVNYELGYIFGILLAKKYIQAYIQQQECFLFDVDEVEQFINCLHIFNTQDKIEDKNGSVVISGNLFKKINHLIRYLDTQMVDDDVICQSQNFVRGIRDVFLKQTYFSRPYHALIEYIQKILWHWFEIKTLITIEKLNRNCRKIYILQLQK